MINNFKFIKLPENKGEIVVAIKKTDTFAENSESLSSCFFESSFPILQLNN